MNSLMNNNSILLLGSMKRFWLYDQQKHLQPGNSHGSGCTHRDPAAFVVQMLAAYTLDVPVCELKAWGLTFAGFAPVVVCAPSR